MNSRAADEHLHFGFRTVSAGEKPHLVRALFDDVATRYDLMNDLMSAGVHRLWKMAMIDWIAPRAPARFLDVAGGTGDVAFRILDRLGGAARAAMDGARITIVDASESMLETGRDRAIDAGLLTGIDWVRGDAESLPIEDDSVDTYTIAFGIRNVARIDRALGEAWRVLKPGGRFLCLGVQPRPGTRPECRLRTPIRSACCLRSVRSSRVIGRPINILPRAFAGFPTRTRLPR